jgi:large subunit ribosomal protein L21
MYAIVKTGGKQYHVEPGRWLLVERLPVEEGASVSLRPLLYVDGAEVVDGEGLQNVTVVARVLGHERGPKFKPKRGYRRRKGHRQELTRIEVTSVRLGPHTDTAAVAAAPDAGEPVVPELDATEPAVRELDASEPVVAEATTVEAGNGA